MDIATQLVQAYLQINGYFTVIEYPLFEVVKHGGAKTVTDIDVLAVRFARKTNSSKSVRHRTIQGPVSNISDPALGCSDQHTDMIVGEVKQGRARVNPGTRNLHVIEAALSRFGCCASEEAPRLAEHLQRHGSARADSGHIVRMVLFASTGEHAPRGWHLVRLDAVIIFLEHYLETYWDVLAHVELREPALAWFALLQKCRFHLNRMNVGDTANSINPNLTI